MGRLLGDAQCVVLLSLISIVFAARKSGHKDLVPKVIINSHA